MVPVRFIFELRISFITNVREILNGVDAENHDIVFLHKKVILNAI